MNIAIAGYGIEGKANYDYWVKDPANHLTIIDERDETSIEDLPVDAATITGEAAFEKLQGFDLVIRTAGLAPHKIKTDGKVWSATNEFFAKCPAQIIGVTGSKGKGTTSSFIASILEAAGQKVWLVGNIGTPSLTILDHIRPTDVVVYELSSFQLWDLERSPHVGVVLFIETEHLDVHLNMNDYVQAKANIAAHQTAQDTLIYHATNEHAVEISRQTTAQVVPYPGSQTAHVRDGNFWYGTQQLCSVDAVRLKGEHNVQNAIAAIDAAWVFTQDPAAIETGLKSFVGLPHRLAFVRTVNAVDYYDDSIATTPGSAIAALRAFPDVPKVLILGGSYKGSDFHELAVELTQHDAQVLLIGSEAEHLEESLRAVQFANYEHIHQDESEPIMQKVINRAASIAQPGSVVLLSPAAASFGLFKNYADRGEQFIAAVNAL